MSEQGWQKPEAEYVQEIRTLKAEIEKLSSEIKLERAITNMFKNSLTAIEFPYNALDASFFAEMALVREKDMRNPDTKECLCEEINARHCQVYNEEKYER